MVESWDYQYHQATDSLPLASLTGPSSVLEGNSGVSHAAYTVSLSSAATSVVTVGYFTTNGTAVAYSDYGSSYGMVEIPVGSSSATFVVSIYGDNSVESGETYTVTLTSPTNTTLSDSKAVTTTIADDDAGLNYTDNQKSTLYLYDTLFDDRPSLSDFSTITYYVDAGYSLSQIASAWGNDASWLSSMSRYDVLTTLYQNTFGRDPTTVERGWFYFNRHETTLADLVSEFAVHGDHVTAMSSDITAWAATGWGL